MRRTCWLVALIAMAMLIQGCAKKQQLTLKMDRKVVPIEPTIESVQFEETGEIDTRDATHTVRCTMKGDAGLDATFDIPGRIKGQEMQEVSPGVYRGSFEITQGEIGIFSLVGQLQHAESGATARKDAGGTIRAFRSPDVVVCTEAQAKELDRRINDLTVYFDTGVYLLTDEAKATLASRKAVLTDETFEACEIHVGGHADSTGEDMFNDQLSRHRSLEVIWYLHSLGVERSRLVPHYYGTSKPIADGRTAAALSKNRRVELHAIDH